MIQFYRYSLMPTEDGLVLLLTTYISVRETHCYHYCATKKMYDFGSRFGYDFKKMNQSFNLRKIDKRGSKIAKPTKEEAYESLRERKKWQIFHLNRELAFAQAFLNTKEKPSEMKPWVFSTDDRKIIPNTEDLVHNFCQFY